jgi:type VI secretion system protein ImpB
MVKESLQKRIERDRPPRVQITYEVELGDALETKELPFVLGVLGEFTGHPGAPLARLKDRRFVQIDRDSFDEVLHGMAPRLALQVGNRLPGGDGVLGVELRFHRLEDFEPMGVVRQVEPLRRLLELRHRLSDLRNQLAGNDRLEEFLDGIVQDPVQLQTLGMTPAAGPMEPRKPMGAP